MPPITPPSKTHTTTHTAETPNKIKTKTRIRRILNQKKDTPKKENTTPKEVTKTSSQKEAIPRIKVRATNKVPTTPNTTEIPAARKQDQQGPDVCDNSANDVLLREFLINQGYGQ